MIKAIIIDDEDDARDSLQLILEDCCPAVEIVAHCSSAKQGLSALQEHKPDLVFLDIQMPHMTGFQMLEHLSQIDFKIIFVTAYDTYAIRAIKYSALDYLVKPVDADELVEAVKKMTTVQSHATPGQYQAMVINLTNYSGSHKKLAVPTTDRIHFLDVHDIIYCEANGNYTVIHLKGARQILSSKTLKEYEILLEEEGFCRVHHASLINLQCVLEYLKGEGGSVKLLEGHHVDISRRKKEEFLKRMNSIP